MSNLGRSVRLFLVDGKPTGLITAEIMNWTGHVLTGPRAELPKVLTRPEAAPGSTCCSAEIASPALIETCPA